MSLKEARASHAQAHPQKSVVQATQEMPGVSESERARGRESEKGGGKREQVDGLGEGAEGRRHGTALGVSEVPQVKASKVKDGCMTGGESWYLPIEVAEGT